MRHRVVYKKKHNTDNKTEYPQVIIGKRAMLQFYRNVKEI